MKNYNKEDLLNLLTDSVILHEEISESKGLVLFKLKQEKIHVPISSLLCPHMSAWAIPYLNERIDELSLDEVNILTSISSGNNYWVNNNLLPLIINVEPFEEKVSIDNPLLSSFFNINSDFIETKKSLHRLAKSIKLEPIKNFDDLKKVTASLSQLSSNLNEVEFNSQYFSGKVDLVKTIVKAAQDANYTIGANDVKQLSVSWIKPFSLEIFGNLDIVIDILEDKLKTIVLNYDILKKSNLDGSIKRKFISEIGLKDNSITDAKNLIYDLSNENLRLNESRVKSILDIFLKNDEYLLDNFKSLLRDIVKSNLLDISDEQKYVGYLNYVNLITDERYSDLDAWSKFMEQKGIDKLPLYYFWEITKTMAGFEEYSDDINNEKTLKVLYFLKNNISWSEFKGFSDIPGEFFSTYEESMVLNKVLLNIYDDFKKTNNSDLSIISNILEKNLVKIKMWKRVSHEDDIGLSLNHLTYEMKDRGFIIKKDINDNILNEKDFFESDLILNNKSLCNIIEQDYSDYKWSKIIEYNKEYNQEGLKSLKQNDGIIPLKAFSIFLEHLDNSGIKDYCENYLIKNWNNLPLVVMNAVKDNNYSLLDNNLFKNLQIDIHEKYAQIYAYSHFLLTKNNGFTINLLQAKDLLSNLNQYSEDDKFSHILFIGRSLSISKKDDMYNFINNISSYVDLSVSQFNSLLSEIVFENLSGSEYVQSVEKYKKVYVELYSQEDYYVLLSDLLQNSKSGYLSYEYRKDIEIFQNSLSIDCENLVDKLSIGKINNLLENENMASLFSVELIKKVADRYSEIKKLTMCSYDTIFKNVLDKKIDSIKKSHQDKENCEIICTDINSLLLNFLEKLKDNPAAYVLMWSSSKNVLMESWKYSKDDGNPNSVSSSEYIHKMVCKYMDIDIFNQGILDLKNKLKHLDNYNMSYGELNSSSREYLDFEVFFRRIYSLTWASCKKSDNYYEHENKSLLSLDKKDKIWDFIEINFPEFFINMDACNVSTIGFNDVQFKDWNKIFTLLSQNSESDSNYRLIDVKNSDSILNSFLNYDAESNLDCLDYLQNIIFVALNSKNVTYAPSYDVKSDIEDISSAIKDWYEVRSVKSSMLVKNIIGNDMRVKEIQALSDFFYLNKNIKMNEVKSNVFKA